MSGLEKLWVESTRDCRDDKGLMFFSQLLWETVITRETMENTYGIFRQ